MFPLKRKRETEEIDPLISKKQNGKNPLELEVTIPELQPLQSMLDKKLQEWIDRQWEEVNNSDLAPEQKKARIHAIEFHSSINKQTAFMTNEKKRFVLDFIDWLQYKDPVDRTNPAYVRDVEAELARLGATKRQGPLDVEGKEEWLTQFVDKKYKWDKEILKLRLGPHSHHTWDLHDAWLFYKFILRGEDFPQDGFLNDFDDYLWHKFKLQAQEERADGEPVRPFGRATNENKHPLNVIVKKEKEDDDKKVAEDHLENGEVGGNAALNDEPDPDRIGPLVHQLGKLIEALEKRNAPPAPAGPEEKPEKKPPQPDPQLAELIDLIKKQTPPPPAPDMTTPVLNSILDRLNKDAQDRATKAGVPPLENQQQQQQEKKQPEPAPAAVEPVAETTTTSERTKEMKMEQKQQEEEEKEKRNQLIEQWYDKYKAEKKAYRKQYGDAKNPPPAEYKKEKQKFKGLSLKLGFEGIEDAKEFMKPRATSQEKRMEKRELKQERKTQRTKLSKTETKAIEKQRAKLLELDTSKLPPDYVDRIVQELKELQTTPDVHYTEQRSKFKRLMNIAKSVSELRKKTNGLQLPEEISAEAEKMIEDNKTLQEVEAYINRNHQGSPITLEVPMDAMEVDDEPDDVSMTAPSKVVLTKETKRAREEEEKKKREEAAQKQKEERRTLKKAEAEKRENEKKAEMAASKAEIAALRQLLQKQQEGNTLTPEERQILATTTTSSSATEPSVKELKKESEKITKEILKVAQKQDKALASPHMDVDNAGNGEKKEKKKEKNKGEGMEVDLKSALTSDQEKELEMLTAELNSAYANEKGLGAGKLQRIKELQALSKKKPSKGEKEVSIDDMMKAVEKIETDEQKQKRVEDIKNKYKTLSDKQVADAKEMGIPLDHKMIKKLATEEEEEIKAVLKGKNLLETPEEPAKELTPTQKLLQQLQNETVERKKQKKEERDRQLANLDGEYDKKLQELKAQANTMNPDQMKTQLNALATEYTSKRQDLTKTKKQKAAVDKEIRTEDAVKKSEKELANILEQKEKNIQAIDSMRVKSMSELQAQYGTENIPLGFTESIKKLYEYQQVGDIDNATKVARDIELLRSIDTLKREQLQLFNNEVNMRGWLTAKTERTRRNYNELLQKMSANVYPSKETLESDLAKLYNFILAQPDANKRLEAFKAEKATKGAAERKDIRTSKTKEAADKLTKIKNKPKSKR